MSLESISVGYDIFLNDKRIDRIYFVDPFITCQQVKQIAIEKYHYSQDIEVRQCSYDVEAL